MLKKELYSIAKELDIKGRSTMSKSELEAAIAKKQGSAKKSGKREGKKENLSIVDQLNLYSMKKKQSKNMKMKVIKKYSDIPSMFKFTKNKLHFSYNEMDSTCVAGVLLNKHQFLFAYISNSHISLTIEIAPDVFISYFVSLYAPGNIIPPPSEIYTALYVPKNSTFSSAQINKAPLSFCKLFQQEVKTNIGDLPIFNLKRRVVFKTFETIKVKPFKAKPVDYTIVKAPSAKNPQSKWEIETKKGVKIVLEFNNNEDENIALDFSVVEGNDVKIFYNSNVSISKNILIKKFDKMSEDELTSLWEIVYSVLIDFIKSLSINENEFLKLHARYIAEINKRFGSTIEQGKQLSFESIVPEVIKETVFIINENRYIRF